MKRNSHDTVVSAIMNLQKPDTEKEATCDRGICHRQYIDLTGQGDNKCVGTLNYRVVETEINKGSDNTSCSNTTTSNETIDVHLDSAEISNSSNLTCFLAKLLEEQHIQQRQQRSTFATNDNDHGSSSSPLSPSGFSHNVTLVSDNARAHSCHNNFRLLTNNNSSDFYRSKGSHLEDVVIQNASSNEEKKEENEGFLDDISHSTLSRQETREEEEESSSSMSIRLLQRPCRWSSDDSLTKSMLPNSPPTKMDYLPTYPRRRLSEDMLPYHHDDLLDNTSSQITHQQRESSTQGDVDHDDDHDDHNNNSKNKLEKDRNNLPTLPEKEDDYISL
jgi:hypothetical protein